MSHSFMRTPTLIFLLIACAILGASEFFVIVNTVPPRTAATEELWVFFISLFVALACSLGLLWYWIKRYVVYRSRSVSLGAAVRQSALLCLIVVMSLFFNSLGILSIWDFVPLCISALLIEFFFQAEKTPSPESFSHEK